MINLGLVRPGRTLRIPFSTFDKDDGSSITMTNYAVADILIYKDGSTTERASTSGFAATTDFDSKTGKHLCVIDLADNTTAGFFAAGSEYLVAVDAVTVDGVTTGGWIARFRIGYEGAIMDTTIATLATQTSFTLADGPAEDDALNGMWAVIHDVASAVQFSRVLISDYTGSTKTVTLAAGATFTAAASDNFSVMDMAPIQPTVTGRTLDVSSTGEAGVDWANVGSPTTTVNLSGTTIATTQKVDIETIKTQTITCGSGVTVLASVGTAATSTAQTGDSFARIGAAGAGLTALGDTRLANLDATVSSRSTYAGADTAGTTTLLSRVVGTIATGTHNPQTGDAYAIVASGTHGNAALKTLVDDVPTVAEFEARTLAAADYFDPAADKVYLGNGAHGGASMTLTFQKIVGASSGNDPCITITGSGTGDGILVTGGTNGSGIEVNAGALGFAGIRSKGYYYGLYARATYLTGCGIYGQADGIGYGIEGYSSSGYGMGLSGNTGSNALYLSGAVVATHASNDIRGIQVNDFTTSAKALLQTEANDALVANNLDHLMLSAVDTDFATTVHLNSVIGHLADNGTSATFDRTTDSLEAVRDRGDAAWTTATGFSTHSAADVWAAGTRTLTAFGFTVTTANAADVTAILADTNELQTDLTNGGRLDLILDDILTDTGTTLQAELDGIQADTEDIQSRLPAALVSGRMDASVGAMAANVVTASALATDAVTEIVTGVLTSQMTEAYAADGVAPTLAQAIFLIQQSITEFTISGTTTTIKKLDGSTTAATLTLNDGTTPTGVTRAT